MATAFNRWLQDWKDDPEGFATLEDESADIDQGFYDYATDP
jgi:hypothetical protein